MEVRKIKSIFLIYFTVLLFTSCLNTNKLFDKAYKQHDEGKFIQAKSNYEKIIKKTPGDFASQLNLGIVLYDLGEYMESVKRYNVAEQINNKKPNLYMCRANSYCKLGNHTAAKQDFAQAIALKGEISDTLYFNIANNHMFLGEYDSALIFYEKTLEINPKFEKALSNIGYTYILNKEFEKAKTNYLSYLELYPDVFNALNNLGFAYLKLGELDMAIYYVNKSIEINPKNAFAYKNMGLINKAQNDKPNACKNLNKALKLDFIKFWGEKEIKELMDYCNE